MQFTSLIALVSAMFVAGTQAKHNPSSVFVSGPPVTFAPNATATSNGTNPSSVFGSPAPTATSVSENASFICFPVGSGFVTNFNNSGVGASFPSGISGSTAFSFPTPTAASSDFNGSTFIFPSASAA